jgi:predicted O-methyltransferase YrrM
MNDQQNLVPPHVIDAIQQDTRTRFSHGVGTTNREFIADAGGHKPRGSFLELGTGTGLSTAWILAGMDQHSRLLTVDNDESVQAIAKRHLDMIASLSALGWSGVSRNVEKQKFDFIFADTWPGKYDHLKRRLGQ